MLITGMNGSRRGIHSRQGETANLRTSQRGFQTLKAVASHRQGQPSVGSKWGKWPHMVSTVSSLCTDRHHVGHSISLQATCAWAYPAGCVLTGTGLLHKQLQQPALGTCTDILPVKLEPGSRSANKLLVVNVLGFYLHYSYPQCSPTDLK